MTEGKTALIIENDLSWAEFCTRALRAWGYDVDFSVDCLSLAEALRGKVYELVIVAACPNDREPMHAVKCVKELGQYRILLVAGTTYDSDWAREAFRLGASDYVLKTYSQAALAHTLNRASALV